MTKISPYTAQALDGSQLYNCDGPGCPEKRTTWKRGWIWYGSIRDMEDDPYGFPTFCSMKCAKAYSASTSAPAIPAPTLDSFLDL